MKSSHFNAKRLGFTLIELMLVVAIIGLLAAIAIPKFAGMVNKATEARTKGYLGAVRSALGVFYAEKEGQYPCYLDGALVPLLTDLQTGGYLGGQMPNAVMPNTFCFPGTTVITANIPVTGVGGWSGERGWSYNSGDNIGNGGTPPALSPGTSVSAAYPGWGRFAIDCEDVDSKGTIWYNH